MLVADSPVAPAMSLVVVAPSQDIGMTHAQHTPSIDGAVLAVMLHRWQQWTKMLACLHYEKAATGALLDITQPVQGQGARVQELLQEVARLRREAAAAAALHRQQMEASKQQVRAGPDYISYFSH